MSLTHSEKTFDSIQSFMEMAQNPKKPYFDVLFPKFLAVKNGASLVFARGGGVRHDWFEVALFSAWYAALYARIVRHVGDTARA